MVKINCAAIETLLESELFGSFTGAQHKGKTGLWETAQNGTLFLDEVGELPPCFPGKAAARHSGKRDHPCGRHRTRQS